MTLFIIASPSFFAYDFNFFIEMHSTPSEFPYFSYYQVYLYGGQVTSWNNNYGEQQLFVSKKVLRYFRFNPITINK